VRDSLFYERHTSFDDKYVVGALGKFAEQLFRLGHQASIGSGTRTVSWARVPD
jgi:hypothetical protein